MNFGVVALQAVRTSLMQLAYPLGDTPAARGFVVLVDSPITAEALREEWGRAAAIRRRDPRSKHYPEMMTDCIAQQIAGRARWRNIDRTVMRFYERELTMSQAALKSE